MSECVRERVLEEYGDKVCQRNRDKECECEKECVLEGEGERVFLCV